jgi:hypothetical protein
VALQILTVIMMVRQIVMTAVHPMSKKPTQESAAVEWQTATMPMVTDSVLPRTATTATQTFVRIVQEKGEVIFPVME